MKPPTSKGASRDAYDPLAYLANVMPRIVIVNSGESEDVSDLLCQQWKAALHAG